MQSSPAVFRVGLGLALAAALVVQTGLAGAQEEQEEKIRETYRARAVTLGIGVEDSGRRTTRLTISIDRWTTDEEHKQLITTLVEKGSKDFRKALQKQEVAGFVHRRSATSVPLRYAREIRVEGKRIIRLATGRPTFEEFEESQDLRFRQEGEREFSTDAPFLSRHPFSLIQLRLDENNEGEGTLCLAVQMKYDKKKATLRVENLTPERVHLTEVTKTN